MPIYIWLEKKTGTKVEVIRSFRDYENPPEGDELPAELKDKEHDWERQIGENQSVVKGNGWGAGKGWW